MPQKKQTNTNSNLTPQQFFNLYTALCEKYGYRLTVTPVWNATNHGTFELSLNIGVEPLPKPQQKPTP